MKIDDSDTRVSDSFAINRSAVREIAAQFDRAESTETRQALARQLESGGGDAVRLLVKIIHLEDWGEVGGCISTIIAFILGVIFLLGALIGLVTGGLEAGEFIGVLIGCMFLGAALHTRPKRRAFSAEILAWLEEPRLASALIGALWDERTAPHARESLTRIFPRIGRGSHESVVSAADLRNLCKVLNSYTVHVFGRDLPNARFCAEALGLMGRVGGENCLATLRTFADARPRVRYDHMVIEAGGTAFAELAELLENIRSGAHLLRPTTSPISDELLLHPTQATASLPETLVRPVQTDEGRG